MQVSLLAVRAAVGVDAGVGKAKAFDGTAVDEVLLHDLFGVAGFGETVPDGFGINDEDGAVLALVEAAGFIDADAVLETGGFDGVLEGAAKLFSVAEGAAGAGVFVPLVEADEEVVFEEWHEELDAGDGVWRCEGFGERRRGFACENGGHGI